MAVEGSGRASMRLKIAVSGVRFSALAPRGSVDISEAILIQDGLFAASTASGDQG